MVVFDQLRISDDGKRLYINAHVNKAEYFNNIVLDSIVIMTSEKVSETDPDIPTEDFIYSHTFTGNETELDLVLTAGNFIKSWETEPEAMNFKESEMGTTLFFVYIKCKGTPGDCTPCRLDEEVTLGVTFDESVLYQKVMGYTKDLIKDCTVPIGFMDFILLWYAFKAAIETEHYLAAIKFYNLLFGTATESGYKGVIKSCGCHG